MSDAPPKDPLFDPAPVIRLVLVLCGNSLPLSNKALPLSKKESSLKYGPTDDP